jgi:hypothetical protein
MSNAKIVAPVYYTSIEACEFFPLNIVGLIVIQVLAIYVLVFSLKKLIIKFNATRVISDKVFEQKIVNCKFYVLLVPGKRATVN